MTVRAILWEKSANDPAVLRCTLCSHYCRIAEGAGGRCRVRVNRDGILYSSSSDRIVAANADPIEKKPLYHFYPGTETFSLGTVGCNMTCVFCQNYTISQAPVPEQDAPVLEPDSQIREVSEPDVPVEDTLSQAALSQFTRSQFALSQFARSRFVRDVVAAAKASGCASVSFTYNEPSVSVELIGAVAPLVRDAGMETIMVSNGFLSREGMEYLGPLIAAANFDLKSFSNKFYRDICGAALTPVLRTISRAAARGWWIELTTLLIPGHNDSAAELTRLARFIKEDLGPHVPWHISRFRPMFRMRDVPATPVADLERARAIGLAEGLYFVYTGNVPGHDGENTFCPECGESFLSRNGYRVSRASGSACLFCGTCIPGVWEKK